MPLFCPTALPPSPSCLWLLPQQSYCNQFLPYHPNISYEDSVSFLWGLRRGGNAKEERWWCPWGNMAWQVWTLLRTTVGLGLAAPTDLVSNGQAARCCSASLGSLTHKHLFARAHLSSFRRWVDLTCTHMGLISHWPRKQAVLR